MSLGITLFVAAVLLAAASMVSAQDSHFSPDHQQIHTPGCLIMREAWEGGSKPCTPDEHDAWLADIRHWRDERRIRIGYDGSRYILRGGSYDQPQGSIWYFPQAYKLYEHGKLLMMAPSMDRSGGVGFRCVQDTE